MNAANRFLRVRLKDTRFGDGCHYTLTGTRYHVALNDLSRILSTSQLWSNTIWFENKISGESVILDWVTSVQCMYDQAQRFPISVLRDYIENFHGELNVDDESGKDWEAALTIRALTKRELQSLLDEEGEIFDSSHIDSDWSICYTGELMPYEECEFEGPVLNPRPDLVKLFKLNKKRK